MRGRVGRSDGRKSRAGLGRLLAATPLLAIALLGATGCWSTVPIGHRALVQMITVDKGQHGEIQFSYIIPTPAELTETTGSSGAAGGQSQVQAVTVQAKSLAESFTYAESLLSRDLYLGQDQQILLSEDLPAPVVEDILDSLVQVPELDQSQMVFAVKGSAVQAATAPDPQEVFPAAFLEHLNSCSTCADVRLRTNLMMTFLKSKSVYATVALPEIVISKKHGPTVRGIAFYRQGKYLFSLGPEESGLYGLLLGRTEKIGLDVPVPNLGLAHLRAIKALPSVSVKWVHGRVVAMARLRAKGAVVGIDPDPGLPYSETHDAIETATARLLVSRLGAIVSRLLSAGIDPEYLGARLYSADPGRIPKNFDLASAMERAQIRLEVHIQLTNDAEVR